MLEVSAMVNTASPHQKEEIAIIGMAGRFPGARSIEEFWQNVKNGVESIRFFTDEDLIAAGVDAEMLADPDYVKATGMVDDVDLFDASFFGFTPKEAEILDPQHRFFLECAWEALEDAGYSPGDCQGRVGVYAGADTSSYLFYLLTNRAYTRSDEIHQLFLANGNDLLCTRTSYKLNLTGPSVNVNTACSTSLVAVHLACQSLLYGECDMALSGGVSIRVPQELGYLYEREGILSPDGHCRSFDIAAQGTVGSNGAGIVVLKRLADAINDHDCIRAVIKGSAINNDGSAKVSFTAPSVKGQSEVIVEALAHAAVPPETIGYVEAHGTGTALGDPIEVTALTQAFRHWTKAKGFCAIGSVKTNVGHLDAAAGITGLIKAVKMIEEGVLPPHLHLKVPNPKIPFAESPFYVNTELRPWESADGPRRAGVTSLGVGGTNAHVILEQAPVLEGTSDPLDWRLLLLSARTPTALDSACLRLSRYLKRHPSINLADAAYTLQVGRKAFKHRLAIACCSSEEAVTLLENGSAFKGEARKKERSVVFLFPGQGAQYVNMSRRLYDRDPSFRLHIDTCANIIKQHTGENLTELLYPSDDDISRTADLIQQTANTQIALFAVEYALARLWIDWGAKPRAMIGHSIGEYVAACLSGVFTLDDAIRIVAERARLMQGLPRGGMIAVPLSEKQVSPYLEGLSLAAVNAPRLCVLSGLLESIEKAENRLREDGVTSRRLHTSHAFHSQMMEPVMSRLAAVASTIELRAPRIPYVSNVSGDWILDHEATAPTYWSRHLRETVRFSDGIGSLMKLEQPVLVEVGPGLTLTSLARQLIPPDANAVVLASLPSAAQHQRGVGDCEILFNSLGTAWALGVPIDWKQLNAAERRCRVPLPTYPFERQRFWARGVDDSEVVVSGPSASGTLKLGNVREGACRPLHRETEIGAVYAVRRDELESRVAAMWSDLMGIPVIRRDDDFFQLGGHSLLAITLMSRIRKEFGLELPADCLIDSPTVARLAEIIAKKLSYELTHDRASPLVKLQPSGTKPPFFFVHPLGGSVFGYANLARHLGPTRPFFGFQDPRLNGNLQQHISVPDLAMLYLNEMTRVEPAGPYFLGGYSFGGIVALEMAQRLKAQGAEVALLVLLDCWPLTVRKDQGTDTSMLADFVHAYSCSRRKPLSLSRKKLSRLNPDKQIEYAVEVLRTSGLITNDNGPEEIRRCALVYASNARAMHEYIPARYPGHIALLCTAELSRETRPTFDDPSWGCERTEIHLVPGDHFSLLDDPNVQSVAGVLSLCLEAAAYRSGKRGPISNQGLLSRD